jgi:carbamoylphosphate synthase large subunit
MKKALLIDTNFSSYPIYKYLEKEGIDVTVIGANPADFLAKSANNFINHNYGDLTGTRKILTEGGYDFLVPGCNDFSYSVASQIRGENYYGIDTPEATSTINNKEKFREFAIKAGISVPRLFPKSEVGNFFPVIVKPVDAYSGRGVMIIQEHEKQKLGEAVKSAESFSNTGTCIVEEFVSGQLYSHTAFISEQKIHTDFVVIEHSTANAFAVDTSMVIVDFPAEILSQIRKEIEIIARELQLVDGLIHTQLILKENKFWFIELTRRCPGDQYSQLIELSTGFPYAEAYTRPFILKQNKVDYIPKRKFIIRHTMSFPDETLLSSIHFTVPVKIERFVPLSLAGDIVKPSPAGRLGVIFLSTESQEEQLELYEQLLSRTVYKMN